MRSFDEQLARLGGVLAFGYGDRILKGFIPQYLGGISLDGCYEYITTDRDLLASVEERHWTVLKKVAKAARIKLTTEEVVAELRKSRPDVLAIILNTPNGREWLDKQVTNCRQKLGLP